MKYTQEYISKRLKEMLEAVESGKCQLTNEDAVKYQEMVNRHIAEYHAEYKRDNIDPLTGVQKVTDEQLKRRFDC